MALHTLVVIVAIDYLTGVLGAIYNRNVSSSVGIKGIIKKIGYFIIVAITVLIDRAVGETGTIRNLVIYFFVSNEGISILENWACLGLPIPQSLIDILLQMKNADANKRE